MSSILSICAALICGLLLGMYIESTLTVRRYRELQAEHNVAMQALEDFLSYPPRASDGEQFVRSVLLDNRPTSEDLERLSYE